eukprot:Skav207695  [mRNA]  locus=scaffold3057:179495:181518:+ [translate_table: standard]
MWPRLLGGDFNTVILQKVTDIEPSVLHLHCHQDRVHENDDGKDQLEGWVVHQLSQAVSPSFVLRHNGALCQSG